MPAECFLPCGAHSQRCKIYTTSSVEPPELPDSLEMLQHKKSPKLPECERPPSERWQLCEQRLRLKFNTFLHATRVTDNVPSRCSGEAATPTASACVQTDCARQIPARARTQQESVAGWSKVSGLWCVLLYVWGREWKSKKLKSPCHIFCSSPIQWRGLAMPSDALGA